MDRECNCSLPSKVNGKGVYEGNCRSRCSIYEVKCCICYASYIGNTKDKFKKRMDGHFSVLQRLQKNGKNMTHCCPLRTTLYQYHFTYRSM